MAWEGSDRRERLPADWAARRVQALTRDGHRCRHEDEDTRERCKAKATEVDHVVRGDDHSLANLQSLCSFHHARKTAREAAEARRRRPSRYRKREIHPAFR